jgi:protein gp37
VSDKSAIEWTDSTWNPVTGCDRVSPGCAHCYALDLAARLKAMGNPRYQHDGAADTSGPGFGVTLHPDKLMEPRRWRQPRRVFVNSMSDLFHDEVPDDFIAKVFWVMSGPSVQKHTFQILTKRPDRMRRLLAAWAEDASPVWRAGVGPGWKPAYPPWVWPLPNVWLGVSVENQHWADERIPLLLETPAAVRFLSCEPLLGPLDLTPWMLPTHQGMDDDELAWGIHWVIVGGESGTHHRSMKPEWARSIRDQCFDAGNPFFFKQWGGRTPRAGGRKLDGRMWDEFPAGAA